MPIRPLSVLSCLSCLWHSCIVAKWLDGSRCHLLWGRPLLRPHCVRWRVGTQLPRKGHSTPHFLAHVCCCEMAGWSLVKMPLGMEVGLGPGHIVFNGDPSHTMPPERGTAATSHFSAHVYCGQPAGWIKMPLGTVVDLGPGHIVLDCVQLRVRKGAQHHPLFSAHVYCGQTVAHLSYC